MSHEHEPDMNLEMSELPHNLYEVLEYILFLAHSERANTFAGKSLFFDLRHEFC